MARNYSYNSRIPLSWDYGSSQTSESDAAVSAETKPILPLFKPRCYSGCYEKEIDEKQQESRISGEDSVTYSLEPDANEVFLAQEEGRNLDHEYFRRNLLGSEYSRRKSSGVFSGSDDSWGCEVEEMVVGLGWRERIRRRSSWCSQRMLSGKQWVNVDSRAVQWCSGEYNIHGHHLQGYISCVKKYFLGYRFDDSRTRFLILFKLPNLLLLILIEVS